MDAALPYREYRLRHVDASGHHTVQVFREWLDPKTNRQRRETKRALAALAKQTEISQGMNKAQRRKLARKVTHALKEHPAKKRRVVPGWLKSP